MTPAEQLARSIAANEAYVKRYYPKNLINKKNPCQKMTGFATQDVT